MSARVANPSTAASSAAGPSKRSGGLPVRIRKGQKIDEAQATLASLPPSVQYIDSPFQLQEYLSLLLKRDPHDVERIVRLPEADVSRMLAEDAGASGSAGEAGAAANGNSSEGKDSGLPAQMVDEELHPIDTDVWVFEQLRRIVLDLSTPWLTALQQDCSKTKHPTTCDAMNAGEWMYLCASHGEEKQCCAIDYIIHTLDGTTALLNSARHFPSRTYIPTTSLRHFGSISRRLSRILVHAKDHHREIFDECESETSLYARFYTLCKVYDLVSIDTLPAPEPPAGSGGDAADEDGEAQGSGSNSSGKGSGASSSAPLGGKPITLLKRPSIDSSAKPEPADDAEESPLSPASDNSAIGRSNTSASRRPKAEAPAAAGAAGDADADADTAKDGAADSKQEPDAAEAASSEGVKDADTPKKDAEDQEQASTA